MDGIKIVIHILQEAIQSSQIDTEKFDDAIELLETAKANFTDDEVIDKIDEIQDYFEYLLTMGDTAVTEETKEELLGIIEALTQWSK